MKKQKKTQQCIVLLRTSVVLLGRKNTAKNQKLKKMIFFLKILFSLFFLENVTGLTQLKEIRPLKFNEPTENNPFQEQRYDLSKYFSGVDLRIKQISSQGQRYFQSGTVDFFMNHYVKNNANRLTRDCLLAKISRKVALLALLETVCWPESRGKWRFSPYSRNKASIIQENHS